VSKTVLFQITGLTAPQKFGVPVHVRNDEHIAERRSAQDIGDGLKVAEIAPCHSLFIYPDMQRAGLYLIDVHVLMGGPNKRTPVLTLTFSDQGEPFYQGAAHCGVTGYKEFDQWVLDSIRRHWKSGQVFKNADNIAVRVVGATKPNGRSQSLSLKELLSGDGQPAQLTSGQEA